MRLYAIDAGGSTTRVAASTGDRWIAPPVNPSSVGVDTSARHLNDLFRGIRRDAEGDPVAVWLASASLDPDLADAEVARITEVARAVRLPGVLVVSNDLTPLVLTPPVAAGRVVAVCGTGSGFIASDGVRPPVRTGGCEYLASDEGSAFDLGLRGLRAALRGLDGRGPATLLTRRFADEAGVPVPELARVLASEPFPKAPVAAYAPVVLRAWLDDDPVAADAVRGAIDAMVVGVRAARDAASLAVGWHLSVAGGVVRGCHEFHAELAVRAGPPLGAGSVTLVDEPAVAVLSTLTTLTTAEGVRLPDGWLGNHAWLCSPADLAEAAVPAVGL